MKYLVATLLAALVASVFAAAAGAFGPNYSPPSYYSSPGYSSHYTSSVNRIASEVQGSAMAVGHSPGRLHHSLRGSSRPLIPFGSLPLGAAGPLVTKDQGYSDQIGDGEAGLAPDLSVIAAVNNASGTLGFGVNYANRICAGSGDFIAIFLDVDSNPGTGSATIGAEYALFLDGSTRTTGVAQWNGSTFSITGIPAAGSCSSTTNPTFDALAVSAASVGVSWGFNFVVGASWSTGSGAPTYVDVAGPYSYSMSGGSPPPPPSTSQPPQSTPPAAPSHPTAPSKTYKSAAGLRSEVRYTGRSIKHIRLTEKVYATMKQLGVPHMLAVACWSGEDWPSVLGSAGGGSTQSGVETSAFWNGSQPRWLHLSPRTCTNLQGLIDTRVPNGQRAFALTTVLHETTHAYGIRNEAQANCYAVQLVPVFAEQLNFAPARAHYLQQLAVRKTKATAPSGYWDPARCRDGGAWDLDSTLNLSY
jgi:hypothetical protein